MKSYPVDMCQNCPNMVYGSWGYSESFERLPDVYACLWFYYHGGASRELVDLLKIPAWCPLDEYCGVIDEGRN